MMSTRSSLSIVWSSQSSGVAGLNTSPALHPQSWMRPIVRSTCSDASGWKLMIAAPAFAKSGTMRSTGFTIRCTSIGTRRVRLDRRADQRPDRQVGNVMVVHHVEVEEVGAGGDDRAHLLAEAREIGGQQRRRNPVVGHGAIIDHGQSLDAMPMADDEKIRHHGRGRRRPTSPISPIRRATSTCSPTRSRSPTPASVAGAAHQPPLDHHRRRAPGPGSEGAGRRRPAAAAEARRELRVHERHQPRDARSARCAAPTRWSPRTARRSTPTIPLVHAVGAAHAALAAALVACRSRIARRLPSSSAPSSTRRWRRR